MDSISSHVFLSDIDQERFGIQIARAPHVAFETLQSILHFCHAHTVKLLIARCDSNDMRSIQAMESNGFFLTDTLLYYRCDISTAVKHHVAPNINIRPAGSGEAELIKNLAIEAFRSYVGHYHADPRLDRQKCDEAYASWAYRSCMQKDLADQVLVAEQDGALKGFVVLKMHRPDEGQLVLNAVHPEAQGSGVYSALVSATKEWCFYQGAKHITTSTHLPNIAVQKVWTRHGFWLTHADCTFHKWFD